MQFVPLEYSFNLLGDVNSSECPNGSMWLISWWRVTNIIYDDIYSHSHSLVTNTDSLVRWWQSFSLKITYTHQPSSTHTHCLELIGGIKTSTVHHPVQCRHDLKSTPNTKTACNSLKMGTKPPTKVTVTVSFRLSKLVWFHTQLSGWVSGLKSVVTHFLGSQSAVVVSHTKLWLPEPASAACSVGVTDVCRCTWWRWWCDINHLMLVWLM